MTDTTPKAALERITWAQIILQHIKTHQKIDGAPKYPSGNDPEFNDYVKLICDAGLIREITVPEGGLQFRITWKGLCFLDTIEVFKQVLENRAGKFSKFSDDTLFQAELAAFSFF